MTGLVRLSYASRFCSVPEALEQDLTHILHTARTHNHQVGISGVLYYGKGFFFQYLEGDAVAVNALYQKLLTDPRHQQVELLDQAPLTQRRFLGWSMKYIALNEDLGQWLQKQGHESFTPHALQGELLGKFVDQLQRMHGVMADVSHPVMNPEPPRIDLPLRSKDRLISLSAILLMSLLLVLAFLWVSLHG